MPELNEKADKAVNAGQTDLQHYHHKLAEVANKLKKFERGVSELRTDVKKHFERKAAAAQAGVFERGLDEAAWELSNDIKAIEGGKAFAESLQASARKEDAHVR